MFIPEDYHNDALRLLEELTAIPAYSGQEKEKADFIQQYLLERGLHATRIGNNLILRSANAHGPVVWLHSHIDTVKAGSTWTNAPFGGKFTAGKLTALGSNDAGASVVAQYVAFRYLCQKNLRFQLIWIIGAEEENSGKGGVESILPQVTPADLVIVGEPTSNQAAVAEKGLLVVDAKVWGKTGHAARNEGHNAIYLALEDLLWLKNHQFEKVSPFLGPVNLNVTVCKSGEKHNVVPDLFEYTIDIRLNEFYSHEEIMDILQANLVAELTPRSYRLKPSFTPPTHPVMKALDELKIEKYGSPTLSDQALIPYPSVKMGPGDSLRSHTADEFIFEEEIKQASQLYVNLLMKTYE